MKTARARTLRTPGLLLFMILIGILMVGCGGTPTTDESSSATDDGDVAEGTDAETTAEPAGEAAEPAAAPKKRKERATSVTVALVARRDLVQPVRAEGTVRARHTSNITFERAGLVTKVWVREGQRVRKGQTLVSLDDRELRLAVEEARSRYLQGLGRLAVEEDGYAGSEGAERVLDDAREALAERERTGEISRDERLDRELEMGMTAVRKGAYRRELIEVRSGLAAARADQARLEIELERTTVRAPFAGVISGLQLHAGEHVQVGQTVARLVDNVNLEAAIGVLESDLVAVTVGTSAVLEIPALAASMPVTVDVVDPEVATDSRTCQVLMRLRSDNQRVKPGMFVRASIAGAVFEDRVVVPREAIVTRDGRPVVFKVVDDRAQWVYVTLGAENESVVEIAQVTQGGPLEAGTPVIVANHLTMTHDAKVKVKETVDVPDPWTPTPDAE